MDINTKQMQATITHEVDVRVALATNQVTEVTAKKYAEVSGMSYTRVIHWCQQQILQARQINKDGQQVNTGGTWFVDVKAPILAKNS